MAGRRQHHTPKFLLGGFSTGKDETDSAHVWFFRKNDPPRRTNTDNVFVMRDFYGRSGMASLDDLVTATEAPLATFVITARATNGVVELGICVDAATLIHDLALRTRWFRDNTTNLLVAATDRAERDLSTRKGRLDVIEGELQRNPSFLSDEFNRQFEKEHGHSPNRSERRRRASIASKYTKKPVRIAAHVPTKLPFNSNQFKSTLPQVTAAGHIEGLRRVMRDRSTPGNEFFARMKWTIVPTDPALILGDCGPLFFGPTGTLLGPIGIPSHDEVAGVLLPISASQLLVGLTADNAPLPTVAEINRFSATWSLEGFISSAQTDETRKLHGLVGTLYPSFMGAMLNSK